MSPPKPFTGIKNLVEAKSETCLQPLPKSLSNLLLHALCNDPNAPLPIIQYVTNAHKEVTMIPNDAGKLPLHIAIRRRGNPATTTQLIQQLIDANDQSCGIGIAGEQPSAKLNLPLHELLGAETTKGIDIDLCGTRMLEAYPDAVKEKRGSSNLHVFPLELGRISGAPDQFMCMMIDIYPSAAKEPPTDQKFPTMVHWALQNNNLENTTLKLIQAHPEAAQIQDSSGRLPIHICCNRGDTMPTNIIQRLLDLFPGCLLVQDNTGNTPLHAACEHLHNNLSFVAGLMIECPDAAAACKIQDREGNLAIHDICEQKYPAEDVIMYMIDVFPDSLKQPDKAGNLPLHSAVERGDVTAVKVVKRMLQVFPGSMAIKDKDGKNTFLCFFFSPRSLTFFFFSLRVSFSRRKHTTAQCMRVFEHQSYCSVVVDA